MKLCVLLLAVFSLSASAEEVAKVALENTVPEQTKDIDMSVEALPATVETESLEKDGAALLSERMYCPPGWLNHGSNCYLLVSNSVSWINAENHCAGLGSSLVSIQNPSEHQFLQSLIQMGGRSITWTGGFYFEGRWMWVDQSRFYYTNWGPTNSASSYPCLYFRSQGGWSNARCSTAYPFICVKKLNC